MKIIKLPLAIAVCSSLLFTNCASILNGKKQTVYLNTNQSKGKIFVNDEEVGSGSTVKTKLPRNAKVQQIRIEEEGYKDEYLVVNQHHKSPLYIMSWIPFGVLFYPPFYDFGEKAYDYKKQIELKVPKTKIQKRTNDQKYVILESTAFDVKKEDLKYKVIKKRNYSKNKEKYSSVETADQDINFNNSVYSDALDKILLKYNYTDTTHTVLRSNVNTLYIKSKVKKIDYQRVADNLGYYSMPYLVTKVEIEWEMLDIYDQSKFKKTISSQSGEFSFDLGTKKDKTVYMRSSEDAITKSFFDFLDTKEVKELIKTKEEKEIQQPLITLKKPAALKSVEDALSATVTIKNSKGHGSGCLISNDGYIVTNFHVVSSEKKELTVIDHAGKEFKAKLIRQNEKNDLALLKVEGVFTSAYTIPSVKKYSIGEDIFVVGTPKSIELGQSLSKGIISGVRSSQGVNYIQTDASVNGGNSGGSIVTRSGELIGIVNSKIFGTGVEGLGFGSPAEEITKSLQVVQ